MALGVMVPVVSRPAQRELAFREWLCEVDDEIEAETADLGRPQVFVDVGFEPKAGLQDYRRFSGGGQVKLSYCAEGTSPKQVQQVIETVKSVLARSGAEGQRRITVVPPGGDETETVWAAQSRPTAFGAARSL